MRTAWRYRARALALAATVLLIGRFADAQTYPAKPVRYVVPFPAGASPDLVARTLTERLAKVWGQQVIVDNRSGAGGTVGAQFAAKSAADGYTLFQCNIASSAIAEALYAKLGYDHQRDFAPLTRIGTTPNALVVHPSMPAKSIQEYVAYARAHPGKLSYGSSGAGTSPQLAMEWLKLLAKIDIVHVSYKGAPQAISDVIGGQIPSGMTNVPLVLPSIQAGRLRGLAVTGSKRVSQLPSVPTMLESGYPGYVVTSWYGVCTNAGTPPSLLDKLHGDITAVLRTPEVQQRLGDMMVDVAPTSRDEFAQFIRSENARWAQVIKEAGIAQQ